MNTTFTRADGSAVLLRWGMWHLTVFAHAIEAEGGEWKDAFSPGWTFTAEHRYEDPDDGERIEILVGDRFTWCWR